MSDSMFVDRAWLTTLIGCDRKVISRMVARGELPRPIQLGSKGRKRFIRSELLPVLLRNGIDLAKLEAAYAEHHAPRPE